LYLTGDSECDFDVEPSPSHRSSLTYDSQFP